MKRALLLLAASCTLAGAQNATARYQVRRGDTLWSIAKQHGLSLQALQRANNLSGDGIREGQLLLVGPVAASAPQAPPVVFQRGMAVHYWGKKDAETDMTAAHLRLPFGTWVRVTHLRSGRSVLVKINDRGPFYRPERIIDLSPAAARALGILSEGVAPVVLEVVAKR